MLNLLCDHDQKFPATACCFCEFPFPYVCAQHLQEKHFMTEKNSRHFHLPIHARDDIQTEDMYLKSRTWVTTLLTAYEVLHKSLEDMVHFSEQLESIKRESPPSDSALCAQAQADLQYLQNAFSIEVEKAISVTKQNALTQVEFPPQTLAYKVWTYSMQEPESLKLFYGEIIRRFPLQCRFGVQLDSLSSLNREFAQYTEEELRLAEANQSQLLEIQQLNAALMKAQEQIQTQVTEIQQLKNSLSEAQGQIQRQLAETQQLKDSLGAAQGSTSSQTSEISHLNAELRKMQVENAKLKAELYIDNPENLLSPQVRKMLNSLLPFDYSMASIDVAQFSGATYRNATRLEDGSVYIGEWVNGTRFGRGKLYHIDGSLREGYWIDGHISYSRLFSINGNVYEGDWKDDKKHGKGRYQWASGEVYEGDWKYSKMHGKGRYQWVNGDVYEGDFEGDKKHGRGRKKCASGDMYDGDWRYDKEHGKGRKEWANGDVYEGDFEGDKKHGKGQYQWANGDVYDGDWKDDKKHGEGRKVWANRDVYEGDWRYGKEHGKGRKVWANGDVYVGDFEDDKKHGKGKYQWANGAVYDGDWKDDKMHGKGFVTSPGQRITERHYVNGERIRAT